MSKGGKIVYGLKFINFCQSLLIAGLLCVVVYLLLEREMTDDAAPAIKITKPESAVSSPPSYDTTDKKIFLSDPELGQIWLPVLASVPECSHNANQLVMRNGLQYYVEDGKIVSTLGIDVSAHQGEIDWKTVKAAGVDFVIIRCGFRGYGSGQLAVDEYFDRNMQGALDAGIEVGVYFYSQAVNAEEAIEEAEMTLSLIGDSPITYPIVYDWEIIPEDTARTDGMTVDALCECSKAFCDTIKAAGFTPMLYQNKRTSLLKLDLPQLTGYDFWLAEYNDVATYYYDYCIWQYCSDGYVPGINGACDMNICFSPYAGGDA